MRLALLLTLLLAAPAQAATIHSGTVEVTIDPDPFNVTMKQGARHLVSQRSLTFQTAAGTWHATRVVSSAQDGERWAGVLATDEGRQLGVRIEPDAEGVVRLRVEAPGSDVTGSGITFDAPAKERYLGFGERSNAVDQRGAEVENYVSDGPYQPEERPAIAAFVPSPGFHPRDDATYFPVPWLLSTGGYGVLLDNDEPSVFELGATDTWSAQVSSRILSLRIFGGPEPADVLRRFTARVGRQPPAAAPFYFGPWWQPSDGLAAGIDTLRRAGALGSVVQTYTHYLPCHAQGESEPKTTAAAHGAGLAITTYFNPMICTSHPRYGEARDKGLLNTDTLGGPYEYRYTGSSEFFVGQFDWTAPGAPEFFGSLLREAVDAGYDGWMEDFGEYTPPDAGSHDGTPGTTMHNRYVTLYHRAARALAQTVARPLARFNRSGWTGAARESQIVWGGDPSVDWGFDGLASAVRQGLSIGLSGVSLWGSDVGGFFALGSRRLTPELLIRWIELGFASPVMRTQANGFAIPDQPDRPQIFDPDVLPVWMKFTRLRTRLYPYLAAAEREYDRTGMPMMRHLALVYPDDPRALVEDEYLLGDDLLVAPVLQPGARERRLYLPAGDWVDFWRGTRLRGGDVTVPAPLDEIPLFVRAGAVLPLLPDAVETLAPYGSRVHLSDRRDRVLAAYDATAFTVRAPLVRPWHLEAHVRSRPCDVRVAGRRIRFRYAAGIVRAHFRARRARVVLTRSRANHARSPGRCLIADRA